MLKADDLLGLDEPGQSGSMRNQRSSVGASSVPMDIDIDDDVGQIVDMTGVKVNDDDEVSFACFILLDWIIHFSLAFVASSYYCNDL
jgi:hypothetical protein